MNNPRKKISTSPTYNLKNIFHGMNISKLAALAST